LQPLPGVVIGTLVGQQFLDSAGFGLHLEFRITAALLVRTRLHAERGKRVEIGRINAQRPLH
jgi:hypothetical protein